MIMINTLYKTSDGQVFNTLDEARAHELIIEKSAYRVELHFTATYETIIQAYSRQDALEQALNEWTPKDLDIEIRDKYVQALL